MPRLAIDTDYLLEPAGAASRDPEPDRLHRHHRARMLRRARPARRRVRADPARRHPRHPAGQASASRRAPSSPTSTRSARRSSSSRTTAGSSWCRSATGRRASPRARGCTHLHRAAAPFAARSCRSRPPATPTTSEIDTLPVGWHNVELRDRRAGALRRRPRAARHRRRRHRRDRSAARVPRQRLHRLAPPRQQGRRGVDVRRARGARSKAGETCRSTPTSCSPSPRRSASAPPPC